MPRVNLSHDAMIRIAAALLADTTRRSRDEPGMFPENEVVIEQNTTLIGAINRARAKDGMTPLPTKVR